MIPPTSPRLYQATLRLDGAAGHISMRQELAVDRDGFVRFTVQRYGARAQTTVLSGNSLPRPPYIHRRKFSTAADAIRFVATRRRGMLRRGYRIELEVGHLPVAHEAGDLGVVLAQAQEQEPPVDLASKIRTRLAYAGDVVF